MISVADELLSGWLARLANFNHCDLVDLLAHVGIDGRYVDVLDFELEGSAARRIASVARTDACADNFRSNAARGCIDRAIPVSDVSRLLGTRCCS